MWDVTMTGAEYAAFLGACAVLALTPGPDTFLTLRFGAQSLRSGIVYTLAVSIGIMVWAVFALTGVAALLEHLPQARIALTWIGGGYLVYLGVTSLRSVLRRRRVGRQVVHAQAVTVGAHDPGSLVESDDTARAQDATGSVRGGDIEPTSPDLMPSMRLTSQRTVFRTGLISSLTNPKTGLFFLAMLPPFLPQSPGLVDHALMVLTAAACILVYGVGLSAIADRAGRLLSGDSATDIIDAVSGGILIALGITVLFL